MKKLFKFYKKLSAIVIVLVMIAVSCNTMAYAHDDTPNSFSFEDSCENPLFSDETEGQAEYDIENIYGSHENEIRYSTKTEQQMMKDAAVTIRDNMVARNTSFSVNLSSTRTDYTALVKDVFNLAISEELANSPAAGDYLAFQYGNYNYTGSAKVVNGVYEYALKFTVTYYTNASQEAQVTTTINNALAKMNLNNLTTYEKARSIYDYICKNCNYDYSTNNDKTKFTAYGAVIKKTAVCQGYSTLLYRMLEEAGIDNRIVTGPNHSWNIVNIDGMNYNVDVTWDDNYFDKGRDYHYFLKCNKHFDDHNRDAQYKTSAFNASYPMAEDCYEELDLVVGKAGERSNNNVVEVTVSATTISSVTAAIGTITVKWNKVPDANGYQLQYATKKDFTDAKSVSIDSVGTVSKTVNGLGNGVTYYVRVRAYKKADNNTIWSAWSAVKNAATTAKPATAAMTSLVQIANGFTVKWNKVSGATGYQVQYSTKADFSNAATIYGGDAKAVSKTVTGRTAGTKYYVRVRAYKTVNGTTLYGSWSASKNVTVPTKPATAKVSSISAVKKGYTVKWNKISGVTGYQVQYSTRSDFKNAKTVYGGNANAVSKSVTGLGAGTKYYVRVRAYKNVNNTTVWGNWSAAKTVTTKK